MIEGRSSFGNSVPWLCAFGLHDWKLIKTIPLEFHALGSITWVTEREDIYECSRCGKRKKDSWEHWTT